MYVLVLYRELKEDHANFNNSISSHRKCHRWRCSDLDDFSLHLLYLLVMTSIFTAETPGPRPGV